MDTKTKAKHWAISIFVLTGLTDCGYGLRSSRSELLRTEKIERIYVAPVQNDSYEAGVEHVVYNALVRRIASNIRVRLSSSPEDADAILEGRVQTAEYDIQSITTADQLKPLGSGPSNLPVATTYNAHLGCHFRLLKRDTGQKIVWQSGFSRSKIFPANNQLKVLGTTSALINDSEFERALQDLADSITSDVSESLLAMF